MIGFVRMAMVREGASPTNSEHSWMMWKPVSRRAAKRHPQWYDYSAKVWERIDAATAAGLRMGPP